MGSIIVQLFQREFKLAFRQKADVIAPLVFFIIVCSLFPLAITPELDTLRTIAPGVIWVAALLATMLSLNRLFAPDLENGSLEQLCLTPCPLGLLVFIKIFTHWLFTGVPLMLVSPLIAIQFGLPFEQLPTVIVSLALGTPVLELIGAISAALTLGLRGGGILMALLVLPLYVPVLIFATGAIVANSFNLDASAYLSILGAVLAVSCFFAPWATGAALRISLD